MKSIKEYTQFISEKFDLNLGDEEINSLMMSFGFKFEKEVEE